MRSTLRVRWPAVLVVLAASTLAPSSAQAQWRLPRPAVAGGVRVRVTQRGIGRRVGSPIAISRDTLVVRWESGATSTLARSRISHLEMSNGRFPQWRRGASEGFAIGAAAGAIPGFACAKTSNNCGTDFSDIGMFGRGAVIGGVVGMSVGAVFRTLRPTDDWRTVERGDEWRIGLVAPTRRSGLGIDVSRAF